MKVQGVRTSRIWCIQPALLTALHLAMPIGLAGQDVAPRVYTPAPVGVNAVALVYAFSTGRVLFDKTLPVENVNGDIHSITGAYSRSIGVLGLAGRFDLVVPFVIGDWQGDVEGIGTTTSRTGFADPVARFALFFIGAPALSRAEFAQFKPKTVVGATLRLRVPLGQYDADRLINLGSNRWMLSPQLGVSHVVGRFLLEAYAGLWFFTDNTEVLGTNTLSQDPLLVFQVHAAYFFQRTLWLALSTRQSVGGATSVNRGEGVNPEANNRIGFTMGLAVSARHSLKLAATTGVSSTIGNDYDTLYLTWSVAF